jgi:hypothetical protein
LTNVVIGSNVSSLSQGVFYGSAVKDAYVKKLTPSETPAYFFSSNPTIHVYASKVAAYQASSWANYGTIVGDLERYDLEQEPVVLWPAVSLVNNADNNDIINAYNDSQKKANVTLQGRTLFKDGKWNTLCLPFALSAEQIAYNPLAGADIRALSSTNFNNGTLTLNFTSVSSIEAGKPYIIKWSSGDDIVNPEFWGATMSNATNNFTGNNIQFKGTYTYTTFNTANRSILFMGDDNTLYYPGAGADIGACRTYFELNGISAGNVNLIKEFVLNFEEDNATSIQDSRFSVQNEDDVWYDLGGRRLSSKPLQGGFYIHNGRKEAVK